MKPQYAAFGMPAGSELIIIAIFFLGPILVVAWLLKMFFNGRSERAKLRSEITRLADEVSRLNNARIDSPRAK